MARYLFSMLGDRDPYVSVPGEAGVWSFKEPLEDGPILSFLKLTHADPAFAALRPDHVTVFYSGEKDKRTEDRVLALEAALAPMGMGLDFDSLETSDPTDYTGLLERMGAYVRREQARTPDAEWFALISPGTPQMQAAWICLAHTGGMRARLLQVREARYVLEPGKRIVEVHYKPLFEGEAIELAAKLLERGDFMGAETALETLRNQTVDEQRRAYAALLQDVCKGYALWDRFQFDSALQHFDRCFVGTAAVHHLPLTGTKAPVAELRRTLEEQRQYLQRLEERDLSTESGNLYAAAERARLRDQRIDCLWRIATLLEMLTIRRAEAALRYACTTAGEPMPEDIELPFLLGEFLVNQHRKEWATVVSNEVGRICMVDKSTEFDASLASRYLKESRYDPAWASIAQSYGKRMSQLRDSRNAALHRFERVQKADADAALALARDILRDLFSITTVELLSHPLSVPSLGQQAGRLRDLLG